MTTVTIGKSRSYFSTNTHDSYSRSYSTLSPDYNSKLQTFQKKFYSDFQIFSTLTLAFKIFLNPTPILKFKPKKYATYFGTNAQLTWLIVDPRIFSHTVSYSIIHHAYFWEYFTFKQAVCSSLDDVFYILIVK